MIFLELCYELLSVMQERVVIFESLAIAGVDVEIKYSFIYSKVYFLDLTCEIISARITRALTAGACSASLAAVAGLSIAIIHIALMRIDIHISTPFCSS